MKKIQCGGFYVDDNAIETREGKPFLKTGGGGGGETKNFYLFEFDDTDQAYYVQNITTGEWDEEYGGTVSKQLLEEFNKDRYDVMSRVLTTLGPSGGVTAQYKPIGVTIYGGTPKFVFYAYGRSASINTTATWSDGCWR